MGGDPYPKQKASPTGSTYLMFWIEEFQGE
jgi:hypothetical protein